MIVTALPTRRWRSPDLQAFLHSLCHQQLLYYTQRGAHQAVEVSNLCLKSIQSCIYFKIYECSYQYFSELYLFYDGVILSWYDADPLLGVLRGKWCADCLMIDGLVGQCGERLINLWKRDENGTGQYPPPTLHVSVKQIYSLFHFFSTFSFVSNLSFICCLYSAWSFDVIPDFCIVPQALLDIYLLDNIDEATKHAIVSFLFIMLSYVWNYFNGLNGSFNWRSNWS